MMTKTISNEITNANELVDLMAHRHSVRVFDETKTIPEATLNAILEAMRLAPASYGLFNVRTLLFPRSEFRKELIDIFHHQRNFITASHFVVFVVDSGERVKNHTLLKTANAIFGFNSSAAKQMYIDNFQKSYDARFWNQPELATAWSAHQAYIVGGVATVVAEAYGVGTCMMEGFDAHKLYEFLRQNNLIATHQLPVLGLALGYPDPMVATKGKFRLPFDEYVTVIDK